MRRRSALDRGIATAFANHLIAERKRSRKLYARSSREARSETARKLYRHLWQEADESLERLERRARQIGSECVC